MDTDSGHAIKKRLIASGWSPLMRAIVPGTGHIQWTFLKGQRAVTADAPKDADALKRVAVLAKRLDAERGAP